MRIIRLPPRHTKAVSTPAGTAALSMGVWKERQSRGLGRWYRPLGAALQRGRSLKDTEPQNSLTCLIS